MSNLRAYTLLTLLAICLLLFGSAAAEVACEDMPCCVGEETAEVASLQTCEMTSDCIEVVGAERMSCETDSGEGCACLISSSQPSPHQEDGVVLTFRFETKDREVKLLILPEEPVRVAEEKPTWQDYEEAHQDQAHASFAAFPNPPPAAALDRSALFRALSGIVLSS